MAVGDDATAANYPLVIGTEEAHTIDTEINRSRDLIAAVRALILNTWSIARGGTGATTKSGARTNLGIRSGTAAPSNSLGDNGDIYLRIL